MTTTKLLGLSEEDALLMCERYNHSMRVTSRDGQYFFTTQDYVPTRVNVSIVAGKVMSAAKG